MTPPAFQFYPDDWLSSADVTLLSLEMEGAYIRLLCYCWREASIPNDPTKLARLVGKGATEQMMALLLPLFTEDPRDASRLIHPRLEKEREKQRLHRQNKQNAGKTGAKSRWDKKKHRIAEPLRSHDSANAVALAENGSPSPSSSPSPEGTGVMRAREPDSESTPPTLEQWLTNASFIGYDRTEAETAWHSLESMGWEKDGQPIQKWRHTQTVYRNRLAERREKERQRSAFSPGYAKPKRRGPNI